MWHTQTLITQQITTARGDEQLDHILAGMMSVCNCSLSSESSLESVHTPDLKKHCNLRMFCAADNGDAHGCCWLGALWQGGSWSRCKEVSSQVSLQLYYITDWVSAQHVHAEAAWLQHSCRCYVATQKECMAVMLPISMIFVAVSVNLHMCFKPKQSTSDHCLSCSCLQALWHVWSTPSQGNWWISQCDVRVPSNSIPTVWGKSWWTATSWQWPECYTCEAEAPKNCKQLHIEQVLLPLILASASVWLLVDTQRASHGKDVNVTLVNRGSGAGRHMQNADVMVKQINAMPGFNARCACPQLAYWG